MKTIKNLDEIYIILNDKNISIDTLFSYSDPKKTKNKTIRMSLGRIWFNMLLPDKIELINEPVGKDKANEIVQKIYEKYSAKDGAEILTKINKHIFKMSSICPVSITSDDFIVSDKINEEKKKITSDTDPNDFSDILNSLSEQHINELPESSGLKNIIESKAKTKPQDIGILTIAKGPTIDIEEKIHPTINKSYMEGLTPKQYYQAAAEARKTFYIREVGTSQPGYVASQTLFSNSDVIITDNDDCGTTKYFEVFITNKNVKNFYGRFFKNNKTNKLEELTEKNYTNILNSTVKFRSPLYCKDKEGICKKCSGTLSERLNTNYLGLLSASVINDVGIEGYAMKARHKTTQINVKEVDFTKDLVET